MMNDDLLQLQLQDLFGIPKNPKHAAFAKDF